MNTPIIIEVMSGIIVFLVGFIISKIFNDQKINTLLEEIESLKTEIIELKAKMTYDVFKRVDNIEEILQFHRRRIEILESQLAQDEKDIDYIRQDIK